METILVTSEDVGKSLLQFLKPKLCNKFSGRQLKRAIEANLCRLNGKMERHASTKLKTGDKVCLESVEFEKVPLEIDPSRILYEDEYLLVYNKPSGINSDEKGLAKIFKEFESVHRLDRETTGVIVFGKNGYVGERLKDLFHERTVFKSYLALVDRVPKQESGTIDNYIEKVVEEGSYKYSFVVNKSRGRHAHTKWKRLKTGPRASLVQCFPKTGRTHQIRLHLKEIGHPILGDYRYERDFHCSYLPLRFMLHAEEISFKHPITGKKLSVKAPIPKDFQEAMDTVLV